MEGQAEAEGGGEANMAIRRRLLCIAAASACAGAGAGAAERPVTLVLPQAAIELIHVYVYAHALLSPPHRLPPEIGFNAMPAWVRNALWLLFGLVYYYLAAPRHGIGIGISQSREDGYAHAEGRTNVTETLLHALHHDRFPPPPPPPSTVSASASASAHVSATAGHLERILWPLASHHTHWLKDLPIRAPLPEYDWETSVLAARVAHYDEDNIQPPRQALLNHARTLLQRQRYRQRNTRQDQHTLYSPTAQWHARWQRCTHTHDALIDLPRCLSDALWYSVPPLLPAWLPPLASAASELQYVDQMLSEGLDLATSVCHDLGVLLNRTQDLDSQVLEHRRHAVARLDAFAARGQDNTKSLRRLITAYASHLLTHLSLSSVSAALSASIELCHDQVAYHQRLRDWLEQRALLTQDAFTDPEFLSAQIEAYIDDFAEPFARSLHSAGTLGAHRWACAWGFEHLHRATPLPTDSDTRWDNSTALLYRALHLEGLSWILVTDRPEPWQLHFDEDFAERFVREDWGSIFGKRRNACLAILNMKGRGAASPESRGDLFRARRQQ
ncbi:uncharacterized protein MYCFIDRAFT_180645 [Pseudocercospora fijiensis CIRAD86]|uniref:Uncharacterized protein n=1 Tax=Pseudocercospora fijiensis (strain CIRAD86) TaxID=383855 RepID=M2ZCJ4_PSEFD|nr:uncharacterized protein MYCFIDRAFT_180645 [Pseudocercospora fijiensis CIRAD86]EME76824.1 hypothetical protein MYCFIDRAFT_180645 [Pseudocercospora fijiensis CIRAD86]